MEINDFDLESIHLLSLDEIENKVESAYFALEQRYEEMDRIESLRMSVELNGVSSHSMEALQSICPDAFDENFSTSMFTANPSDFNKEYGLESFSAAVAATLAFIGKYIQYIIPLIIAAVVSLTIKLFGGSDEADKKGGGGGKRDDISKHKKAIAEFDKDITELRKKIKSSEGKKKVVKAYDDTVAKVDKGPNDQETHKRFDVDLQAERIRSMTSAIDYNLATAHPAFSLDAVETIATAALGEIHLLIGHIKYIYGLLEEQLSKKLHGKDLFESITKIHVMYVGENVYKSPYVWGPSQLKWIKGDDKTFKHVHTQAKDEGGWDVELEDSELNISWGRLVLNEDGQPATKLKEFKMYGDIPKSSIPDNFVTSWGTLNLHDTLDDLQSVTSKLKGKGDAMEKKSKELTKVVSKFTKKGKVLTEARDEAWAKDGVKTTVLCYPSKIKSKSKNYVKVGEDLHDLPLNDLNQYEKRISWINNVSAIQRLSGPGGPISKLLDGIKREYVNFKDCTVVLDRNIHAWTIVLEYRKACEELRDLVLKIQKDEPK